MDRARLTSVLWSTPYISFKQIRSPNVLRKMDEHHVDTEGSSIETMVKGEVESSVFFSIYTQTLMHPHSRNIQPTWLLVSWLVDNQARPLSWEAVKHKYLVHALVSAISYWNVQLIVISFLAINVSKCKKLHRLVCLVCTLLRVYVIYYLNIKEWSVRLKEDLQ